MLESVGEISGREMEECVPTTPPSYRGSVNPESRGSVVKGGRVEVEVEAGKGGGAVEGAGRDARTLIEGERDHYGEVGRESEAEEKEKEKEESGD